jgi:hypothetical protein
MTRIESIIALLKANTGASTVAPTTVATYANLAETITLETISSGIMATSPLKGAFDGLPTADLLDQMFISLFGYTQAEMDALKATEAGAAGYQYWINELANNSDMINVNTLAIALLNGAAAADATKAAALVADDVDAYEIYAGTGETPVETDGETFYLTPGQDLGAKTGDAFFGTDGNDLYIARGNNTLNNADIIDGGKGTDTVSVMLDKGETAESPLLTNIEILKVQVQATTTDSGDNDVDASNLPNNDIESNIDAGDMKSVEVYINDNSRADLTIEDVSRNSHITTLVMRETDMGDVDYNVFFDSENITAPGTADQGATLLIKLANVLNIAENTNPVENFEALTFTVGATPVTADISAATSYDDVVTAIQAAISAAGLVGLTVQKQADAPAYFSIDVATYAAGQLAGSYNPILITNNGSGLLTPGQIELANNTTNANMTNTMTNVEGSTIPSLTQTNVVFDRVGRDSKGGDFIAGSDSTGDSGSKGIEQFNVSVDRDSWLTSVSSTNNTLEVINIKNIKENSNGNGSLRVDSISDVRVIDASAMTGSANITAELTDNVVSKYLNLTDTQSNPAADNSDNAFLNVVDTYFSYDFGSNNDTFDLAISNANLAAAGTTTREDFVMEINGGAGNDIITTKIGNGQGTDADVWYINSTINANLTVNGGEGNDTITTKGAGNFVINAGSGNDTVYTDNIGIDSQAATWVVGTSNTTTATLLTNLQSGNGDINLAPGVQTQAFLVNGKLTVTLSDSASAAAGAGDNGYEVVVDVPTTNYVVTALQLNQAIKNAINNDAVLSKLLVAKDGPANTLVITSKIDGVFAADDLAMVVSSTAATATQETSVLSAYKTFTNNVNAVIGDANTASVAAVTALNALNGVNGSLLATTTAVAEVQTLEFTGTATGSTNITIASTDGNITIDVDGMTADKAADAFKLAIDTVGTINGNAVTTSVTGGILTINYTVADGNVTDILVTPDGATNGITVVETIVTQGASLGDITGVNSTVATDNTVTLGAGDDVAVLSTSAESNDTLVFSGSFGNDTIVNFVDGNGAGADVLDFSAYLTSQTLTAGVTATIATSLDTVGTGALVAISANEVVVNNNTLTQTQFDALTGASLLADLNDSAAAGTSTLFTATNNVDNNLIGTTYKSILMVENAANDGEYKVFELTVSNSATGDDFTAATLVGTVDFGDTVTLDLAANLA